jgi:hypothetical protein
LATIIPAVLRDAFTRNAEVLGWKWVPDDHVVDSSQQPVAPAPAFGVRQDYVVLRLAEMYLKKTRRLWREYYPVVHAFVAYGDPAAQRTLASIAGPAQLKELGTDNLERLIGLAYRLAGPTVYDGQDIELLAGLYAVPARDAARLLIDTLSQLTGLVPALKQATDLTAIIKDGVEGLLGISGTRLALGIHDALRAPNAGVGRTARPGFVVAVNAPASSIKEEWLWVKGGRLCEGPNPIAATEFKSNDMMLFELHRGPSRAPNWATLPSLAQHSANFDTALRQTSTAELPGKINNLFRRFELELGGIDNLTDPDKAAIRAIVAGELKRRVEVISGGGLIEEKSVDGPGIQIDPRSFHPVDFADFPAGPELPSRPEGWLVIQ